LRRISAQQEGMQKRSGALLNGKPFMDALMILPRLEETSSMRRSWQATLMTTARRVTVAN
jgi:hypothetical protein